MSVPSGSLTVGLNRREAISPRYAGRGVFRYSGRIEGVRIEPGAQAPHTPMNLDEAAVQVFLGGISHGMQREVKAPAVAAAAVSAVRQLR